NWDRRRVRAADAGADRTPGPAHPRRRVTRRHIRRGLEHDGAVQPHRGPGMTTGLKPHLGGIGSGRAASDAQTAAEAALVALTLATAFGFCRLFFGWSWLPTLVLAAVA